MLVSSCGVEDSLRELSALSKDSYESSPGGCRGCSIPGEPEQPGCVISSYLQEGAPVEGRGPSTARTDSKRIGLAPLRVCDFFEFMTSCRRNYFVCNFDF